MRNKSKPERIRRRPARTKDTRLETVCVCLFQTLFVCMYLSFSLSLEAVLSVSFYFRSDTYIYNLENLDVNG